MSMMCFLIFKNPIKHSRSHLPLVSPLATSILNFCAICCNSNAEKFLTHRSEATLSMKNLLTVSQTCAYNPSPAKSQQDHHHPHQVHCTNFQTWKLKRSIITIGDSGRSHKKKERKKEKPIGRQTHTRGV